MFHTKSYVLSSKLVFYVEHNLALVQKKLARRVSEELFGGEKNQREEEFDVDVGTTGRSARSNPDLVGGRQKSH